MKSQYKLVPFNARRRVIASLAFATLAVAPSLATPIAANAASASADSRAVVTAASSPSKTSIDPITVQDTSCNPGDLCFWVNINRGGAKGRVSGTNSTWPWTQAQCAGGTWNNCASSIVNNGTQCTARVWADASYGGAHLDVLRGNDFINLTDHYITFPFRDWNDEISSNSWVC
jgi:hypothetical protein